MKFKELFHNMKPILGMVHLNSCHGTMMLELAQREIEIYLRIGMRRCDAIVCTGEGTGLATPMQKLSDFKDVVGDFSVIVGAGVTFETAEETALKSDGAIVGSWFKDGHYAFGVVNEQYVEEFMKVWNR